MLTRHYLFVIFLFDSSSNADAGHPPADDYGRTAHGTSGKHCDAGIQLGRRGIMSYGLARGRVVLFDIVC